jgi:hypothetical protein
VVQELIGPVLTDYVNLAAAALLPRPGRIIHIAPGRSVPWDECCEGQLWGRLVSITPMVGRQGAGTSMPCGVLAWDVQLAVGIIRCVHTIQGDGPTAITPTPREMTADGQQALNDLVALEQVILCHPKTVSMVNWLPLGNLGGCGGGEWTFNTRVPTCGCP